jgi:hypothetical protein
MLERTPLPAVYSHSPQPAAISYEKTARTQQGGPGSLKIPALLKNKVGNRGNFLSGKKCPSRHHVYHAFHHVFTTKTPPENAHFPENPPAKTPNLLTEKYSAKHNQKTHQPRV